MNLVISPSSVQFTHPVMDTTVEIPHEDRLAIPIRVAAVLQVPLSKVIGFYDGTPKLLAIAMEIYLRPGIRPAALAKKYNINRFYMIKRLGELHQALGHDPLLAGHLARLEAHFYMYNPYNTEV